MKMVYSPSFNDMREAIYEYLKQCSEKQYRFTVEEQLELERLIKVLDNQCNMLIDYELKREKNSQ